MASRTTFSRKRKVAPAPATPEERERLAQLAASVLYVGNPAHKRNPHDFGLAPPFGPRPDKTLCDDGGITEKAVAEELLREGLRRGVVSVQMRGTWPQNVWAVRQGGLVLEAMLGNQERGEYHGYPLPMNDPFREEVIARWGER